MVKIKKLTRLKGLMSAGLCHGCGKSYRDDNQMVRVEAGHGETMISFCLCDSCRRELLLQMVSDPCDSEKPPTNMEVFQTVFGGLFVSDLWVMSAACLKKWADEPWRS